MAKDLIAMKRFTKVFDWLFPFATNRSTGIEEPIEELAALADFLVAEGDPVKWPEVTLTRLVNLLNADIAALYIPADASCLEAAACFPPSLWNKPDFHAEFSRRPVGSFGIGRALREGTLLVIDDPNLAADNQAYYPFTPEVRSEFIVPIFSGDTVASVVVLSRLRKPFSKSDRRLMQALSSLLSTAYSQAQTARQRQLVISFLKKHQGRSSETTDEVIEGALSLLMRLLGGAFSCLWVYNEIDSSLVLRGFLPRSLHGSAIEFDDFGSTVLSLESRELDWHSAASSLDISLHNLIDQPESPLSTLAVAFNFSYFFSLPVRLEKLYGLVSIFGSGKAPKLDQNAEHSAKVVCAHLATLFQRALYEDRERVFFAFDDIVFRILESGDQQEPWDRVAMRIADLMNCEACSVFFASAPGVLQLRGSTGIEGHPAYSSVTYQPGQGLTGSAFISKEPVIYYSGLSNESSRVHISKHREILTSSTKSRSILLVSIREPGGFPLGVIRCNNKEVRPGRHSGRFTNEDVDLLLRIGHVFSDIHKKTSWLAMQKLNFEATLRSIHHELISPVHGILTQTDWMQRAVVGLLPSDKQVAYRARIRVNDIEQAARQVELTVRNIGAVAQERIRLRPSRFEVKELMLTCRSWITHEASRKSVKIDVAQIPRLVVNWDRQLVARVFQNLFVNAIKYSDSNELQRYVKVSANRNGSVLLVLVEDNGIGIDEGEGDAIFEPSFRGTRARLACPGGAGLGLTFCRQIVAEHSGTIRVASFSKPTVFAVGLPRSVKNG